MALNILDSLHDRKYKFTTRLEAELLPCDKHIIKVFSPCTFTCQSKEDSHNKRGNLKRTAIQPLFFPIKKRPSQKRPVHSSSAFACRAIPSLSTHINQLISINRPRHEVTQSSSVARSARLIDSPRKYRCDNRLPEKS